MPKLELNQTGRRQTPLPTSTQQKENTPLQPYLGILFYPMRRKRKWKSKQPDQKPNKTEYISFQ